MFCHLFGVRLLMSSYLTLSKWHICARGGRHVNPISIFRAERNGNVLDSRHTFVLLEKLEFSTILSLAYRLSWTISAWFRNVLEIGFVNKHIYVLNPFKRNLDATFLVVNAGDSR